MRLAVVVPAIIAVVLWAFALVFVLMGRAAERGYWAQRDPSGDPAVEATSLMEIAGRAGTYAVGEYRAPLRIMAIGLLIGAVGIGFALVTVLIALTG